ncbi:MULTISPECIES: hypothetical protein [unclassified Microbacterium]|uniref:hypothetical protein n=1 Tax=unclassified Microbacterium TaxID=2609290 RepID=UPI00214CB57E|nr:MULTISPECIES: hypothetical protein [unclassified Microbacterium]MCR2784980.1 hypothetical protein [Microbacterium sp. zg.B96]MDL5352347.1 hypothetical protein [Microbacterium sp. zg-YB36]WIM16519.1 hypothetical protein QNO11_02445 [Microbacterium sp. zg-B96]
MQSPPSSTPSTTPHATRKNKAPYAIVGGATLAAAAIVAGFIAIPAVSGATGAEAPDTREVAVVTDKPVLGAARDALSQDELSYALHLATAGDSLPDGVTSVDGSDAPQVLSIDVATRDVDQTDRIVDVVLYDYTSNKAILQSVNLTTAVIDSSSREGVQPPPSADEIDFAFSLFLADEAASAAVREEFTAITGDALASIDQLGVSGGSFVPDAGSVGGEHCAIDRCVEMQFRVPGGGYLDTTAFVVDLSTRSVIGIR